jgi:hypothetical protein
MLLQELDMSISAVSVFQEIHDLIVTLFTRNSVARLQSLHRTVVMSAEEIGKLEDNCRKALDELLPTEFYGRDASDEEVALLEDLRTSVRVNKPVSLQEQDAYWARLEALPHLHQQAEAVEAEAVKVNEVLIEIPEGLLNEHGHLTGFLDWFRSTGMVIPPKTRLVGLYKAKNARGEDVYCRAEIFEPKWLRQYLPEKDATNYITDDVVVEHIQGNMIKAEHFPYIKAIPAEGEIPDIIWRKGLPGYEEGIYQYSVNYIYMWMDRNLYAWWHAVVQDKNNPKDSAECRRLWKDKTFATPLYDISWRGKESPSRPTREELQFFERIRTQHRTNENPSVEWIDAVLRDMLTLSNVNWLAGSE